MVASALFSSAQRNHFYQASNAAFSPGTSPFSVAAWIKLLAYPAIAGMIIGKWSAIGSQKEWRLAYSAIQNAYYFAWCPDGSSDTGVPATIFGVPALGQWNLVVGTFASGTARISVNAGAQNSNGVASYFVGSAPLRMGYFESNNFGTYNDNYLDAAVARVGYWGGRQLSTSDITTLYNGGVSLSYAQLPAGLLTNLTAWWDLGEASGKRIDSTSSHFDFSDRLAVMQSVIPP